MFVTNSHELQECIKNSGTDMNPVADQLEKIIPEDNSYAKSTLGDRLEVSSKEQKVLRVLWNFAYDDLVFSISDVAQLANKLAPTKRTAVSLVAKFYDPLRFLYPITVQLKILFQSLCKAGIVWDEPLNAWRAIGSVEIIGVRSAEGREHYNPKCYLDGIIAPVMKYSLQEFSDALLMAYGIVLYLKIDTDDRRCYTHVSSNVQSSKYINCCKKCHYKYMVCLAFY